MERQFDSRDPATPQVVVGIDGSEGATHALAWALHKTDTFGRITPVTAVEHAPLVGKLAANVPQIDLSARRSAAEAYLKEAVLATDPSLLERAQIIEADPGPGLVATSSTAELLVVGTRGRRAAIAGVLGSVSAYCAAHATVPVAVVPPGFRSDKQVGRVLIGIDDSENARAALRWTIDHVSDDTRIDAIAALPTWGNIGAGFDAPREVIQDRLQEILQECVAEVTGGSSTGPRIRVTPIPEDVTHVMRKLTDERFDLLVLGGRGRSGLRHLLSGSVSSAMIHRPTVPTIVIPSTNTAAEHSSWS